MELTKKEFIKEIREMADNLENNTYHYINLESGYFFANKNYGEVAISIGKGINMSINLFTATEEEKKG